MKQPTLKEEKKLWRQGYQFIAGLDEVGRGAWAGPLVAAAVIMPLKKKIRGVNDSKKLIPQKREKLYIEITQSALAWSVCVIENYEIDKKGISAANRQALVKAAAKLHRQPDYLLVDALKIRHGKIPVKSVIKGDEKIYSIAAASIVAKVTRDEIMRSYHKQYPHFHFHRHKGYGTARHRQELKKYGTLPIHRRSFSPIKDFEKKGRRH